MSHVTVIIPTYKRPDSLDRLLGSLSADLGDRPDVSIRIVDNDASGSAEAVALAFKARQPQSVDYIVEAAPGVSNARNAGIEGVATRYILFLDDDMEVVPPFLQPLLEASQALGTALTFSPIDAQFPATVSTLKPWLSPLYSRQMDGPSRRIDSPYGTGGCLINLDGLALPSPAFDPALNEVGGEDDAFFHALIKQGATVGWCAEALAWEHVPEHRATAQYLWRRHFAFGQTPTREAADKGLRGLPEIAKWTLVGGAQTLIHGSLYLMNRLLRRPARVEHMGRLAQGLGKMLWWDSLSPRLYGAQAK